MLQVELVILPASSPALPLALSDCCLLFVAGTLCDKFPKTPTSCSCLFMPSHWPWPCVRPSDLLLTNGMWQQVPPRFGCWKRRWLSSCLLSSSLSLALRKADYHGVHCPIESLTWQRTDVTRQQPGRTRAMWVRLLANSPWAEPWDSSSSKHLESRFAELCRVWSSLYTIGIHYLMD